MPKSPLSRIATSRLGLASSSLTSSLKSNRTVIIVLIIVLNCLIVTITIIMSNFMNSVVTPLPLLGLTCLAFHSWRAPLELLVELARDRCARRPLPPGPPLADNTDHALPHARRTPLAALQPFPGMCGRILACTCLKPPNPYIFPPKLPHETVLGQIGPAESIGWWSRDLVWTARVCF